LHGNEPLLQAQLLGHAVLNARFRYEAHAGRVARTRAALRNIGR
jgi:hypothetical protein